MNIEIFQQILENIQKEFYENASSGSLCRRTDRQGRDEASSLFS